MGRPTEAQKAAKAKMDSPNGAEPVSSPPPEFSPEELNLIHSMLVQVNFQESQAKILAGQLQAKIEMFVGH